jgi:hypothetical protein
MSRLLLPPLLALIAVAAPLTASAQRVVHRVRFGETLASIAKHYYGKRSYAPLIQLANELTDEKKISAGERIRIPTSWIHTVRRTTTIQRLARQLLGDKRRWPALSLVNKVGRRKRLRAGARVIIPYRMRVTAAAGETFEDLSQRYFGEKKFAKLIATYNFTNADRPTPSSEIEIPLGHLRILPLRLEDLTNERLLGVAEKPTAEHRAALQEANAMLRRGEYLNVPLRLVRLLSRDQSSDRQTAEVFKLLAIAYVAVNRRDLAVNAFEEALLRLPTLSLDPIKTSPKVMRAFVDAKSRMRKGAP